MFPFTGTITRIGKIETVGEKQSQKVSFSLLEYPEREKGNSITLDLWKNIEHITMRSPGDIVTVKFNVSTREGKDGRRYNSVSAFSLHLEKMGPKSSIVGDVDNDLPF